jgi:hypothetical protein
MGRQHALLLLKGSIHLQLRHLLRQLNPRGLEEAWGEIDTDIEIALRLLIARSIADPLVPIKPALIGLPVREGGLGIPLHAQLASGLYLAAQEASKALLNLIQPRFQTSFSDKLYTTPQEVLTESNTAQLVALLPGLSVEQKRARLENASYLGRQWLRVLPIQKQYQFTDSEAIEALRTRLLVPCRPISFPCTHCGATPTIGHEDVCRAANRQWINRHNQVIRAFTKTLASRTDLEVVVEPKVSNSPTNDLRADFSVKLGTSRYYYDIQVVAINKASARLEAQETLTEAANAKRLKYQALGGFFHPLIFSAGGLMEKDTAQAYKGLQKLLGPINSQWLDNQIALILARFRATAASSIATDLPSSQAKSSQRNSQR